MDLTKNNSLNLKSEASEFFLFECEKDLHKILEHAEVIEKDTGNWFWNKHNFSKTFSNIVIKSTNNNFKFSEEGDLAKLEVGAAVIWDDLIDFCCSKNLHGLENLAGIPGTVGAAPIQNIGAYGVEISDLIDYVECFDTKLKITRKIRNENCDFAYRKSVFQEDSDLIVTAI